MKVVDALSALDNGTLLLLGLGWRFKDFALKPVVFTGSPYAKGMGTSRRVETRVVGICCAALAGPQYLPVGCIFLMADLLLASMHHGSTSFNKSCWAKTSCKFNFAAKAKEMLKGW